VVAGAAALDATSRLLHLDLGSLDPRLDLSDLVDLGFFGDLVLGWGFVVVFIVVRAQDWFRVLISSVVCDGIVLLPDLGRRVWFNGINC